MVGGDWSGLKVKIIGEDVEWFIYIVSECEWVSKRWRFG